MIRFHGFLRAEVRDLSAEVEGDNPEANDNDKRLVRALAWTGFPRTSGVKEASDAFGSSEGNEKNVEVYVFFPVSRPSTSLLPFKMQGPINHSGHPLHQRANLTRKEYESRING